MADILIIGGGVSGLSAGIYAQKAGHRVVICEKLPTAGGNLTGWRRDGFTIDNCVHWLTGTNPSSPLYETWEDVGALGGNSSVYHPASLYTCEQDGKRLSLRRNWDSVERDLLDLSPEDSREIHRLSRAVRALQDFCGIGGPRKNRGITPTSLLFGGLPLLRAYRLSTGELAEKFRHPLIRSFLTSFLTDRVGALALLFVMAHFCGGNADLPAGGSLAMAERMVETFRAAGGKLLLGKEALRIECRDGRAERVLFSDGTEARADEIVVTLDPAVAFPRLLGIPVTKAFAKLYRDPHLFRFSSFHCAFACDTPTLPFRGDFVWTLPPALAFRLNSPTVLLREFSHEPSFAPAGKSLLQVMLPCAEDAARRSIALRACDAEAYADRKHELADLASEAICEKFPTLKGRLSLLDVWTPATYRRFVGSEIGSFMSFLFGGGKLPARVGGRVPGIENLTFACQWQRAPGGLPNAAESGKLAALALARKYRSPAREKKAEKLPLYQGAR